MRKLIVLIVVILLMINFLPGYLETKAIKNMGFEKFNPTNVFNGQAADVMIEKGLSKLEGKDFQDHYKLDDVSYVEEGDTILITVDNGNKELSKEFTFLLYFPYNEEIYVQKIIGKNTKYYRISEKLIDIKKIEQ